MLKVELHSHTDIDPLDHIPYSTRALIDHAARLKFDAIAVTPHDKYFDPSADAAYARARGITLIAGIERTIQGKHVLLLNFPNVCARVETFSDIAALKAAHPRGLVVAPHAFFPNPSALGRTLMDQHAALFDAVEVNALYTRRRLQFSGDPVGATTAPAARRQRGPAHARRPGQDLHSCRCRARCGRDLRSYPAGTRRGPHGAGLAPPRGIDVWTNAGSRCARPHSPAGQTQT